MKNTKTLFLSIALVISSLLILVACNKSTANKKEDFEITVDSFSGNELHYLIKNKTKETKKDVKIKFIGVFKDGKKIDLGESTIKEIGAEVGRTHDHNMEKTYKENPGLVLTDFEKIDYEIK